MPRDGREEPPPTPADRAAAVGVRAQVACLVELAAPNPGNVRPGRDLPGLTAGEMMTSAAAIGPALSAAGGVPLGATILRAVRATREWVDTNTNLGIVLLLAPPARAVLADPPEGTGPPGGGEAVGPGAGGTAGDGKAGGRSTGGESDLWERLEEVLRSTTVRDAELAYRAIRLAEPGGLGRVPEQDVADTPTVPLREAMRRAAARDAVAGQYASGYALLREVGVPTVQAAREEGLAWEGAAHRGFVRLLAERPDSLVARKFGEEAAVALRREARRLLAAGPPEAPGPAEGWEELDRRLRSRVPPLNPGTTADLTAAAVFLALLLDLGWTWPPGRS